MDPLQYCLRLLKTRLRSRFELQQAMKQKGISSSDQDEVLQKLENARLVDDAYFARAWIHTRDRLKPRGASVLRMELLQKGIDKTLLEEALKERAEEALDPDLEQPSELDLARRLVKGRERLYSNLSPEARNSRLSAYLQRRGFSYDVIRVILK